MRSVIHHSYGEPADVLQLTEAPEPGPPAAGEVRIRVLARPIHPGDLLGVRGRYRAPGNVTPVGPDGLRPGLEGMGVIDAVGAGIAAEQGLVAGARVAFFPVRWTWSDQVLAPARYVTAVPDDLPDAAAALLHVAPLSAAMLLRAVAVAGARPGAVIALSGAGSLVARLTASLLLEEGYVPVGLVRSHAACAALALQIPGMQCVGTAQDNWSRRLCAVIQGRPVHVALDAVGGTVGSTLASLLADGGTLVAYGDLSGEALVLPSLAFSARGITVAGISVGRWAALPDAVCAADRATALRLARTWPAWFEPAGVYGLQDVAAAIRHAERPGRSGTILLA